MAGTLLILFACTVRRLRGSARATPFRRCLRRVAPADTPLMFVTLTCALAAFSSPETGYVVTATPWCDNSLRLHVKPTAAPAAVQASAAALAKVLQAEGLEELPGALIREHCRPVSLPPRLALPQLRSPTRPYAHRPFSRLPRPVPPRDSPPQPDSSASPRPSAGCRCTARHRAARDLRQPQGRAARQP